MYSLIQNLSLLIKEKFSRNPKPVTHINLNRMHYRKIWNDVSVHENDAKMAVSGYIDEDLYRSTGEGTRDMLQQFVGINQTDIVLEIGAGVGRVGAIIAPLCRQWIGADVSENMLKHAAARLKHFDNVQTLALNGFNLSNIESETIDLVYCTVVFMHLDEWERYNYIQEGFRVLKPGGRMLVDNVNLASDEGWAFFLSHCAIPPDQRPAQISKTSTPQELETYFTRSGFESIEQVRADLWIIVFGKKPANCMTPHVLPLINNG